MRSIGEIAREAGIATSAVRYYEREGLIPLAARKGGKRVYDDDVLDHLALIQIAKAAGFTVKETRTILAGINRRTPPGPRWRKLAERKLQELNEKLEEIERMKRALEAVTGCACPTMEDCARAIRA